MTADQLDIDEDDKLIDSLNGLATCVVPSALLLRFFPPFLHPVLSFFTHSLNRVYKRRALKTLGPYIEHRLNLATQQSRTAHLLSADNAKDAPEPLPRDDVLTWLINDAVKRNEDRKGLVDRIACRVFVAVFAATETTTMTISHALLDLCASPPSQKVWEGLEEEGQAIFSAAAPLDLARINAGLPRADSALKETLRLRTSIKALATEVTAPQGLDIKGHDVHLPRGSRLSVSAWGIHRDPEVYGANADEYDAFRFARDNEQRPQDGANGTTNGGMDAGSGSGSGGKVNLMVTATENYLPFGMGRHSCPGRYFAAVEGKLFLAYLAVNYDLKLAAAGRPQFVSIGHFPIPPVNGRLMVRRKIPGVRSACTPSLV